MNEDDFDAMYGKGMHLFVTNLINDLAPVTRRDEWWSTPGPYEIIAMHFMGPSAESVDSESNG